MCQASRSTMNVPLPHTGRGTESLKLLFWQELSATSCTSPLAVADCSCLCPDWELNSVLGPSEATQISLPWYLIYYVSEGLKFTNLFLSEMAPQQRKIFVSMSCWQNLLTRPAWRSISSPRWLTPIILCTNFLNASFFRLSDCCLLGELRWSFSSKAWHQK